MIICVTDIKTAGNPTETMSDREFLEHLAAKIDLLLTGLADTAIRVDHVDVQVHAISQFIDEHRPALARGLALMSAGSKLGAWRKSKD